MTLSEKERDRLKVLHEVKQGHLKQRQGAEQLGMSERGFRKLLKRFRGVNDSAVVHGLRGRRSNRGVAEETATKAVEAVKREYRDFGPTLAAEYLDKDLKISLSRETLRQLMIREGLWKAKTQKISEVHVWRPRRSCQGELVQWDTSVHAWLEEPGPKNETQLGRAFRELGIEWIAAHSPQAKGRIERCFGTLQDRLVKGLRKAGAKTEAAANEYLEREFLNEWNERFTVPPANSVNAHRPHTETLCLESILSHVEQRQVTNDYTVAWEGRPWQIPKAAVRPGLRRSSVRIEARLDGSLQTRIGEHFVTLTVCEKAGKREPMPELKRPARRHVPQPGESRWMQHFSVARQK